MKYILLTEKKWHDRLFNSISTREGEEWLLIQKREDFNLSFLSDFGPDKIFIPHWSYIIPEEIYNNFECVVFHMTDLPFGRGGSPLQNLISRGIKETKVTALRVTNGIDTGDVYLKKPLALYGTAEEIFIRTSFIIEEMINEILFQNIQPVPQTGEPVVFKRRKPGDSNVAALGSINEVYDYIRMLDAEGYPAAFVEGDNFKFEFTRASLKSNNTIIADVRITER